MELADQLCQARKAAIEKLKVGANDDGGSRLQSPSKPQPSGRKTSFDANGDQDGGMFFSLDREKLPKVSLGSHSSLVESTKQSETTRYSLMRRGSLQETTSLHSVVSQHIPAAKYNELLLHPEDNRQKLHPRRRSVADVQIFRRRSFESADMEMPVCADDNGLLSFQKRMGGRKVERGRACGK